MATTIPATKPEHRLMKKTSAGGSFGIGIKRTEQTLSLVPTSITTNKRLMILMASVFAGSFIVLVPAINEFTYSTSGRVICYGVVGLIGICIVAAIFAEANARARRTGTVMVIDKSSGDVHLPNERATFRRSDIEHLQLITVQGKGNHALMTFTELNLVAKQRDMRVRAPIVGEITEYSLIADAIDSIIQETDLPLLSYTVVQSDGEDQISVSDMRHGDRD